MRNEILRHKKIARNKKRRIQRKKSCHEEHPDIRKLRIKSFATSGSRHGARLFRKIVRQKISKLKIRK